MRTNFSTERTGVDCNVRFYDTSEYDEANLTGHNVATRALFDSFVSIRIYNPDNSVTTLGNTLSPDVVIDTTDSYWSFQELELKKCGLYIIQFINVPKVNQSFYNKGECMTYNGFFYECVNDNSFLEVITGVPQFTDGLGVPNRNFKEITLEELDERYYRIKAYECETLNCMKNSLESLFCKVENGFIGNHIIKTEEYRKASELFISFKALTQCLSVNEGFRDFINQDDLKKALNIRVLINFLCCCCNC